MKKALLVLITGAAIAGLWLLPSGDNARLGSAHAILPNNIETIVLISIDTIRADRMSCYGYEHRTTPNIDKLAEDSLFIQEAFSTIPLTLPAHSSMLTGLIPPTHGVHDNWGMRLPAEVLTLAEIMKDNGYATYGIVSSVVLESKFAMNQGFDVYDDSFIDDSENHATAERLGSDTTESALEWLSVNRDKKKFMFMHYYDPHGPYLPPAPFSEQFRDPYDGEIAFTDHCIGQVMDKLESLDLYRDALIVITGDHGEMLGEHGEAHHSFFVYQSAIRVPMMFKLPRDAYRVKVTEPCSIIDIAPTVLAIAGIDIPEGMQGINLLELAQHDAGNSGLPPGDGSGRAIYSESLTPTKYNANSLLSVISGDWHYIQTTQPEIYNWVKDPAEVNNLIAEEAARAERMQSRLRKLLEASVVLEIDASLDLDSRTKRALESLGYAGGPVSPGYSFDGTETNPTDVLEIHNDLSMATFLIYHDQVDEALALCQKIIKADPNLPEAYLRISECYGRLEQHAEQIEALETRLDLIPDDLGTRKTLASVYIDAGRIEEAEQVLRQLMLDDPHSMPVRTTLCDIIFVSGRFEEARELLRQIVLMPDVPSRMVVRLAQLEHDLGGDWRQAIARAQSLDPRDPVPWAFQGEWLDQEGDNEGAERAHRKVVELDARSVLSLTSLGRLVKARGQLAEAEALFQRAVAADPRYAPAWFFLGVCARDRGEADKALEYYQRAIAADEKYVPPLINLGSTLRRSPGRHADAERYLLRAIELEPESFVALINLGTLYMSQQNAERALWAYGRASEVDPKHSEPWTQIMVLHRLVGDMNKALAAAEKVLSINPEEPVAHMIAALCCEALGRPSEADTHVRAALAADPARVQVIVQREPSLGLIVARVQ